MLQESLDKPLSPKIIVNNIGSGWFSLLVGENLDKEIIIQVEVVKNKAIQLSFGITDSVSDINEASDIDFFECESRSDKIVRSGFEDESVI